MTILLPIYVFRIHYLESGILSVESRIQDCLG